MRPAMPARVVACESDADARASEALAPSDLSRTGTSSGTIRSERPARAGSTRGLPVSVGRINSISRIARTLGLTSSNACGTPMPKVGNATASANGAPSSDTSSPDPLPTIVPSRSAAGDEAEATCTAPDALNPVRAMTPSAGAGRAAGTPGAGGVSTGAGSSGTVGSSTGGTSTTTGGSSAGSGTVGVTGGDGGAV